MWRQFALLLIPFFGLLGCVEWLQAQLFVKGAPEATLRMVNLPDGDSVSVVRMALEGGEGAIFALGLRHSQLAILTLEPGRELLLALRPGDRVTIDAQSYPATIEGSPESARWESLSESLSELEKRMHPLMAQLEDTTRTDSVRRVMRARYESLLDSAQGAVQRYITGDPLALTALTALQTRDLQGELLLPLPRYRWLYRHVDSLHGGFYTLTPLHRQLREALRDSLAQSREWWPPVGSHLPRAWYEGDSLGKGLLVDSLYNLVIIAPATYGVTTPSAHARGASSLDTGLQLHLVDVALVQGQPRVPIFVRAAGEKAYVTHHTDSTLIRAWLRSAGVLRMPVSLLYAPTGVLVARNPADSLLLRILSTPREPQRPKESRAEREVE